MVKIEAGDTALLTYDDHNNGLTDRQWRSANVADLFKGRRVRLDKFREGNVAFCYCCTLNLFAIQFDTREPSRVCSLESLEVL